MVGMEMVPKDGLGQAPASLLKVAQGPLLSSLAYSRAVEVVVSAAKRGIAGSEWRDATVRLLQSRSNSSLALLWSFLSFHKCSLDRDGSSDSVILVAQKLLHSLKFMTAGFCGGPTAIAAAAPIVQMVVSSLAKDTNLSQEKKWRKVLFELSEFVSLCHHKEGPVTHGLFKAPSVNLGLDIWLSEESDFFSLFPFATQLKVDGFRNSIESVLQIGEIVETEVALLRLVVEILQNRASSNKEDLERKLKHDVILYSKFLGSSGIILDMLLDAPLKLGDILEDKEEILLRIVLSEMAVITVPNSEIFDVTDALSAGDTAGKESVLFLKRVIIARQLAADFRSRNEYLRASDLLAGLHRRGAPESLGEWLGDRSSLRLLICTDVLEKPQALLDWLLNATNADFNIVLEKSYIQQPKMERLEDLEETQDPDTSLFFIDTSKAYDKASTGFDADQAYLMAAGDMQVATKEDVLFDRSEQLERKRTRSKVVRSNAAKKMKQKKDSNGAKMAQPAGDDITDSDDISTSEDESEEESEMSCIHFFEDDVDETMEEEVSDDDGESDEDEDGDEDEDDVDEKMEEQTKERKKSRSKPVKVHVENVHGTEEDKRASSFFSSSAGASFSAQSFGELNLSRPLIRACEALGYKQPTPIQAACIPLALTGRDICGSAVTGSGKTGAFALPMLERLLYRPRRIPAIRCLILTPTRELAVQVHEMVQKLAQFTDITSALVVGGLSSKVQEVALRARPDIVVATPGRILDHLQNSLSVGLEDLSILVLDEADRLLELGFTQEVHELVRQCPKRRQTMLFSATMTEQVSNLINLSLNSPVRLSADPSTKRPISLSEEVVKIRPAFEEDKESVLLALCTRTFKEKVIIFSGMKVEAHRLKILFTLSGLKAAELHGNLTQNMRLESLESFKKQEVDFLIATDVAARGLDIVGVETVINFHCPADITIYVHRVGRTARAGRKGCAVTFVTERERSLLKAIAKKAGSQLKNRQVAPPAIYKWRSLIEMEDGVREVMQAEREEKALRKAEMEVNKAQNMMEHEKEIYSRPKREWFLTTKEKRATAKAGKDGNGEAIPAAMSVEEADEVKRKEKRKREREKNMTRRQRRKLEAEREDAEYVDEGPDSEADEEVGKKRSKKGKPSEDKKAGNTSVLDLAYRRAKAAKSVDRLVKAGKIGPQKKLKGSKTSDQKTESRKAKAEELFEGDFSEDKRKKKEFEPKKPTRKPGVSKRSFKSKSRYKRRK